MQHIAFLIDANSGEGLRRRVEDPSFTVSGDRLGLRSAATEAEGCRAVLVPRES